MVATTLVYNFGQTVLDSSKKKKKSKPVDDGHDPDEHQIVEGFEGECEQCEEETPKKTCPVCGE